MNFTCNVNTTHAMSEYCLAEWDSGKNPKNECFTSQYRDFGLYLEVFNLAFLGFNTFVGIVCNLLTLISIPMAAREKRYFSQEEMFLGQNNLLPFFSGST